MSVSFSGSNHAGPEVHHYYRQAAVPTASDPLQVGDLWSDTSANVLKRCTSTSPVTFVSVEGGSAAHDLFSATHSDVDEADTPADNDVLTYDSAVSTWKAEPASGHGEHHAQAHGNADHTTGVAPADVTRAAAAEGSSAAVARADHKHDVSTAAPGAVMAASASEGTATSLARSDHVHSASGHRGVKAIAIADPAAGDNFGGVFFDRAVTISQVNHTQLAGTNVVYNIHHATTRNSATPNKLWTSDKTVTSESGEEFTTFDDATVPPGSYVWWKVESISGAPSRFESSFEYTED